MISPFAPRRSLQPCEIWGVLNVTPDSFSDGNLYRDREAAVARGLEMAEMGADVIDVGGASSRPKGKAYGKGFDEVGEQEELERVIPVVLRLVDAGLRVSIDTTSVEVAARALALGARIVNDVSADFDPAMVETVAAHNAQYVIMHNRGQGEVTPENTRYDGEVVHAVLTRLQERIESAVAHGLEKNRLYVDPGIGFAKTALQSATLLANASRLGELGVRVLIGSSRKGFIGELAPNADGSRPSAQEREPGSLAAAIVAVEQGSFAVRVHDVAATYQAVRFWESIRSVEHESSVRPARAQA